MGHSFSVYGPLLAGLTTVLYEGKPVGTPDAANFWRTIERHRVNVMFTAPTALRGIKAQDEKGELAKDFDLSCFRAMFLAGERADTDSIKWAEHALKVSIDDIVLILLVLLCVNDHFYNFFKIIDVISKNVFDFSLIICLSLNCRYPFWTTGGRPRPVGPSLETWWDWMATRRLNMARLFPQCLGTM